MKKKHVAIFLGILAVLAGLILAMALSKSDSGEIKKKPEKVVMDEEKEPERLPEPEKLPEPVQKPTVNVDGTSLFIGDSRTVGLKEYAQIEKATFFCDVGMSVFAVREKKIDVKGIGKVTLKALLNKKKYDKIYIMLGVNEIGYAYDKIIEKYGEVLDLIVEKQPDAAIICEANLHVTKKGSDGNDVVNNKRINKLNKKIQKLAAERGMYFLDANEMFDDETGNMSEKMSADAVHPLAKYYKKWGTWIEKETKTLLTGK